MSSRVVRLNEKRISPLRRDSTELAEVRGAEKDEEEIFLRRLKCVLRNWRSIGNELRTSDF